MGRPLEAEPPALDTAHTEKPIRLQMLYRVSKTQILTLMNYIWEKIEKRYEDSGSSILPSHDEWTGEGALRRVGVYQVDEAGNFITIIQNNHGDNEEGTIITSPDLLEEVQDVIGPIGPYPALPPWPEMTQEQQKAALDTYSQP